MINHSESVGTGTSAITGIDSLMSQLPPTGTFWQLLFAVQPVGTGAVAVQVAPGAKPRFLENRRRPSDAVSRVCVTDNAVKSATLTATPHSSGRRNSSR